MVTIALGSGLFVRRWPREPTYGGMTLGYWLTQLTPPARTGAYSWLVTPNEELENEQVREAQLAIHSMGVKAVPFLLGLGSKDNGKHAPVRQVGKPNCPGVAV